MHIVRYRGYHAQLGSRRAALLRLLEQPSDKEVRPCFGCVVPCACDAHSPACCCGCSPGCPSAAAALSSEPERYPIEPLILPLVYQLSALRVVQPCWSCEGHAEAGSTNRKVPQVWFHAPSELYPDLLATDLAELAFDGTTRNRWVVTLCPHGAPDEYTTFAVHPDADAAATATLECLQRDVAAIASGLPERLRRQAESRLERC